MDIHAKIAVLDQIYHIFGEFSDSLTLACDKGCAWCCTCNVTLTTLEAYKIISNLAQHLKTDLYRKLKTIAETKRFQPRLTTNAIAELCIAGRELPEEENDAGWGTCPFLADAQCSIYAVRPLGCRSLMSSRACREAGFAVMDDFVLTVNTVFMQFTEHVDARGLSGNLSDVLALLQSASHRDDYIHNRLDRADDRLVANRPLKALLIPPAHRIKIEPILQSLRNVKTPG